MPMDFTVTEISGFQVIKPVGRVDWEGARFLDKEVQRLIDAGHILIVFNLDEVNFICSGGIGALVYNRNKLMHLGGAVYVIADNEYISYVFEALKFDMIFEGYLYKTFEEFSLAVLGGDEGSEKHKKHAAAKETAKKAAPAKEAVKKVTAVKSVKAVKKAKKS
jgi:anti-anti-sigma factor